MMADDAKTIRVMISRDLPHVAVRVVEYSADKMKIRPAGSCSEEFIRHAILSAGEAQIVQLIAQRNALALACFDAMSKVADAKTINERLLKLGVEVIDGAVYERS